MATRRRWTRDQLLAALNLYHQTPFGKPHSTHPPIVELAEMIGRTPGAVAMKLNNFTSLDPAELERGIKGLTGASQADQDIWAEFTGRMLLSPRLEAYLPDPELEATFLTAAGRKLVLPEKNLPDPKHLAWHRQNFEF